MNRDDVIQEIQAQFRQAGQSLNEAQRRRWAALEALRLGRGGIALISRALRISPNTIRKGIREVEAGAVDVSSQWTGRIRSKGGGRKANSSRFDAATEAAQRPLNDARSLSSESETGSVGPISPLRESH